MCRLNSVYAQIIETLAPLGIPYAVLDFKVKDGENLPDRFLIYAMVAATSESYFSNDPTRRNSVYRVNFFTRDRKQLEPISEEIRQRMREAGFFFVRFSPDIPHDSGHFSRAADFRIYQKEET